MYKQNYKVSFVILHYLTLDDTLECIESIVSTVDYPNYEIIIVDNGSYNNTGEELKKKFENTKNTHILLSDENLGFSKGNNIGFKFAIENLNSDFIVMINNDMIFTQSSFLNVLIEEYEKKKFHVLGPDIISLIDKKHQNPCNIGIFKPSRRKLKNVILKNTILLTMSYFYLDIFFKKTFFNLKNLNKKNTEAKKIYKKELEGCMLHGSCLIFSPLYILNYRGLFDKTFLYLEEDILHYIANQEKLTLRYSPKLHVFHKEDSSTNKMHQNSVKKRRFIYKNVKKSAIVFLGILNNREEYIDNIKN